MTIHELGIGHTYALVVTVILFVTVNSLTGIDFPMSFYSSARSVIKRNRSNFPELICRVNRKRF